MAEQRGVQGGLIQRRGVPEERWLLVETGLHLGAAKVGCPGKEPITSVHGGRGSPEQRATDTGGNKASSGRKHRRVTEYGACWRLERSKQHTHTSIYDTAISNDSKSEHTLEGPGRDELLSTCCVGTNDGALGLNPLPVG